MRGLTLEVVNSRYLSLESLLELGYLVKKVFVLTVELFFGQLKLLFDVVFIRYPGFIESGLLFNENLELLLQYLIRCDPAISYE